VESHLVLYDGVCGLCNRLLQFVLRHDRRGVFHFAALQSAAGRSWAERAGADPDELLTFYVLPHYRSGEVRPVSRSTAVLFVAGTLGWPWKGACALRVLPAPIRDALYGVVARTRYRIFGRYDACPVPPPEFRSRFID
jgi:predicted DCC family thiol-disulfide oxidoreductase YuxK